MLTPQVAGALPIRSAPEPFQRAFAARVREGLMGARAARSNYAVTSDGPGRLVVEAADWSTAIAVGLNWLELRPEATGRVRFHVRYWRWTAYAVGLSAIIGTVGLILLTTLDVRGYIASHERSMVPGLSVDQNLAVAWGMVLFWGFLWPWLLVSLHKPSLRRLVARLVAEVDAETGH
jgi:hypothetical protein